MRAPAEHLVPVKRHRGEPGHTRTHESHRRTSQASQPTNAPKRPRRRPNHNQRPTQRPQPRSRPLPAADSEAAPCEPDPAAPRSTGGSRTHSRARPHPNPEARLRPDHTRTPIWYRFKNTGLVMNEIVTRNSLDLRRHGARACVPPVGKTAWDFAFVIIATQQSAGRWT